MGGNEEVLPLPTLIPPKKTGTILYEVSDHTCSWRERSLIGSVSEGGTRLELQVMEQRVLTRSLHCALRESVCSSPGAVKRSMSMEILVHN